MAVAVQQDRRIGRFQREYETAGLRFAGDGELTPLVEQCLRGELATTDAVKRAVRDWRPDFIRA